jgi:hypothetical protein
MARRLTIWGAVLVATILLAFLLQGTIQDLCIVPGIELLRLGGLFLRSVPESVFWGLLVAGSAFVALGSLGRLGRLRLLRSPKKKQVAVPGPIGRLAQYSSNARRGLYFRWLLAHRLAELAQAISFQGSGVEVERPWRMEASGTENQRAADIQAYMEAGLSRPPIGHARRRFFSRRPPSPLDLDSGLVVDYLESQMETKV